MSYGRGSITLERGRYRVRVPNGKGGYVSIGARPTRSEAESLLDALHLEREGAAIAPGHTLLTYGFEVIERWKRAGLRDVENIRSVWRVRVARAPFANEPPAALDRTDIRDWARGLPSEAALRPVFKAGKLVGHVETGEPLSWAACNHALGTVVRVLGEALEDGLVTENVARGVKLPKRTERAESFTFLKLPEIAAVLALDLTDQQRLAITLAIYQGMRQGELAALRWSDVDFEGGWIVIAGSWGSATKSGRVRRIPLLAPARAALEATPLGQRVGLVLPGREGSMRHRGYDWAWGERYHHGTRDLPTQAGITRRVRFHDLRHTCAAHLVSGSWGKAWTIEEVREYLGHSDSKVTMRYAHLAPDALHATAKATAQPAADLPHEVSQAAKLLLDFASLHGLTHRGDASGSEELEADRQARGRFAAEAVILALEAGAAPEPKDIAALAALALSLTPLRALTGDLRAAAKLADDVLPDAAAPARKGAPR